ncbi:MAG: hypothetical protein IJO21_06125 [Oscillospiraceae bacterium]|nr:hypothetical protein [Oscillospiraceae bacterium]MBQ7130597.1 hypothetical protein [Oscillospiraceae bacterium]
MNNETQRRINAYKAALPALRERVIAVALLLAMSASMLTSASYAWITLSTAPEVSGMATTVAANGNLEIALVQGSTAEALVAPGKSQVGDSGAAEEQTMKAANVTWGNLVNLSDPVYGLSNIALRPALLNDFNLTRYPLYGATYGKDGRVISTSDRYVYSSWNEDLEFFDAGVPNYGVRAISSVQYSNETGNAIFNELWERMELAYGTAKGIYADLIDGKTALDAKGTTSIAAITGLIQVFAQDKVNYIVNDVESYSDCGDHLPNFYQLMLEFEKVLRNEGQALLEMANLQAFLYDTTGTVGTERFKSVEELLSMKETDLAKEGVVLTSLTTYKQNLAKLEECLPRMAGFVEKAQRGEDVLWPELEGTINEFVNINNTTLNGVKIGTMNGGDIDKVLGGGEVVITQGILKDTEQRLGECMSSRNPPISTKVTVKYIISLSVSATVRTAATMPYDSGVDKEYTTQLNNNFSGMDAKAKDTYGMAIDLWVRTNAIDSVLTLEGTTIYEEIPEMGVNQQGDETELYTLKLEEGNEYIVYMMEEDGTETWYYADNHEPVDAEVLAGGTTTARKKQVVAGFQGENRIWEEWEDMLDRKLIAEDNTTQGAGSCFIFYADPSEQPRILDLLNSFTVAFIDQNGRYIGMAMLNTENAYAINGKVTVPLEVVEGTAYTNDMYEEVLGIMPLEQNEATMLTAVVYLNGTRLENENVLASGEIQGRLNIQFGSSVNLNNPDDVRLQKEYRTITAVAQSGDQISTSDGDPLVFNYTGTTKDITVTLTVDGDQPERITGFFQRIINATQGTRGNEVSFKKQDDGTWTANTFGLTAPGKYALRSLIVDGVEYNLEDCPSVNIEGLSVNSVDVSLDSGIHMTAESRLPVEVTASINATPELMPAQIRAQFRSTDGEECNALMSYDSRDGLWKGTADIISSGTYTLQYLVMDGNYTELEAKDQVTLIVYLGMKAVIEGRLPSDPYTFEGEYDIPVTAVIQDNTGAIMRALPEVKLYYRRGNSSLTQDGMDGNLTWDANEGVYKGKLTLASAGTFQFAQLVIKASSGDTSTITKATAPVFTAISPEPPAYVANVTDSDYQVNLGGNGSFKIRMNYASGASVYAEVVNVNDPNDVRIISGAATNHKEFVENGEKVMQDDMVFNLTDGEWKLNKIYCCGVYDADSNFYPGPGEGEEYSSENSLVFDVSGENITAYVVTKLNISITQNGAAWKDLNYGNQTDAAFMTNYDLEGFKIHVSDWNNRAVEGVSEVMWTYKHDGKMQEFGGYNGASPGQADYMWPAEGTGFDLTANTELTEFAVPKHTLAVAGVYSTKATVTIGEENDATSYSVSGPTITVKSLAPSIAITNVSNNGTKINVDQTDNCQRDDTDCGGNVTSNKNTHVDNGATPSFTATTANVYFKCTRGNTLKGNHNYSRPSVTITLYNMGNATKAELAFGTSAHVYEGTTKTGSFVWAANGAISRNIGYYASSGSGTDTKTSAGTLNCKALTLTYGGKTYEVATDITINNPY